MKFEYETSPAAIYEQSFSIVEAEAKAGLDRLPPEARAVAVRMIHACGVPEIVEHLVISPDFVTAASAALRAEKPVYMDAEMVRMGLVRTLMSPKLPLYCTTHDPRAAPTADRIGNTRSAAGVALWEADLEGGLAVFGNAPTALFYCLEQIASGALPKPAAIVGLPVGFVGAAESKQALVEHAAGLGLPYLTLRGRMGGSAMASAVVNALAKMLSEEAPA
ncbi:MAG: precorrin-8X methylmutase [Alphaproteobacteria bacterium TMED89]|nr:precorrin-8X methylmutase [Rhodospirillaceae bacterium]RPH10282.1 MAG: precorrin-8X methylmutase [Alphaproteobacteria bacterium TMED89]